MENNNGRMSIVFAGDYYPNRRVKQAIMDGEAVFSDEITSLVSSADCSVVNYESPISEGVKCIPISKVGPCLQSSYKDADVLKMVGFKVATLANNHILDQGADALLNTVDYLNRIGLKTVGVGKNKEESGKILYVCHASLSDWQ